MMQLDGSINCPAILRMSIHIFRLLKEHLFKVKNFLKYFVFVLFSHPLSVYFMTESVSDLYNPFGLYS